MVRETSKPKLALAAAIFIGAIGAFGQAYLLYHELANCLPYKELAGYQIIATAGVFAAPLIAVAGGYWSGLRRMWFAVIVPVVLCPMIFAGIFLLLSPADAAGLESSAFPGEFTVAAAQHQFYSYTLSLVVVGPIIGALCSVLLVFFEI